MSNLIGGFNIGSDSTRVAIRTYASQSRPILSLADFDQNIPHVIKSMEYTGGNTNAAGVIRDVLKHDAVFSEGGTFVQNLRPYHFFRRVSYHFKA